MGHSEITRYPSKITPLESSGPGRDEIARLESSAPGRDPGSLVATGGRGGVCSHWGRPPRNKQLVHALCILKSRLSRKLGFKSIGVNGFAIDPQNIENYVCGCDGE